MRGLRRALIALGILAALFVAVDFGLRLGAQSWVSSRVEDSLHLSERPSVSFGGFPFVVHALSGDVDSATISAERFRLRGVRFSEATLHLERLKFPVGKFLAHHEGVIRVGGGDGELVMTEQDLTNAFHEQGVAVTVQLTEGLVRVSSDRIPGASATATARVEDGQLVLRPTALPVDFRLHLPDLPEGVTYEDVRIEEARGVLTLEIDHARLAVGKG